MKVNSLIVTLAVGMLVAAPAHAWTWNNATYASRYRPAAEPAALRPTTEVQVAVMPESNSQPDATKLGTKAQNAKDAHPFGPPRPHAVKSH
jgi:hypothetical protein